MTDIVDTEYGLDIGVYDTQTSKAGNILSVQLGSLEYLQTMGIDLKYFLSENLEFQNESFKSYLVEVLANNGINVASVVDVLASLAATYTFNISPEETSTGLIAR